MTTAGLTLEYDTMLLGSIEEFEGEVKFDRSGTTIASAKKIVVDLPCLYL
jgi:hypothetical protein